MLVLVGNTLDHYGIFTLDDAHKNHDHSKNNKEHADVWASNETTLRIGTPPSVDIFGNTVTPKYDNYTSGYDATRNDTHFHYAAHTFKDVSNRFQLSSYINFVTIFFGIIGMAFLFVKTGNEKPLPPHGDTDLFRYGAVRAFFRSRYYRYIITIPVLLVFIAIILAGIFDTQDGRQNIATIYTWTVWWTLIIFSFILAGRLWCMVCPFAFIGDMAQKIVSFNKRLPRFMQNMGFQTIGFIALTFAYAHFALYQKPFATSLLILGILFAAILGSIIFRKRTFCRYLCPIGAVIGLYSTVSPFKITPSSQDRCTNHKSKTCSGECPMLEDPYNLDSNLYCNYCMKCLPSCPSGNLSLKYRGFGRDILDGIRRSPVEAVASLMLFGLVLYETLAMTTALPAIKGFVSTHLSVESDTLLTAIIYLVVIAVPSLIFGSLCYGLSRWLGGRYTTWQLVKEYAFSFIPLGIGLHLAHNLSHLFTEAPVAVPATIRFLGKAGLMDTAGINWNPLPPVGAEWIFLLQMLTIIVGFLSTIFLLYKTTKRLEIGVSGVLKTAIVMTTFAIISVSITFYMIGLPMNGRHVH
ncbi:MAG: 4Fe-4S binding protein [Nitrospirae bacterium]|nr:MAG: 4Fe-4S binding protein [Nitrospirota bacterium]